MIEVEQQFSITQDQADTLVSNAKDVKELPLEEVYFDFPDFRYLKQDIWLRKRNNRFELKRRPQGQSHTQGLEQYEEYYTEAKIKNVLDVPADVDLQEFISTNLQQSIVLNTKRKSFELDAYLVDIDFTEFGYIVCEIERQATESDSIEDMRASILALALKLGLSTDPARNKAKEYIVRRYPELVEELQENGVL